MADQPVSSAELKKLRTPVRARFTKASNELETESKKNEVKKAVVEKILRRLQTHHEKLSILNMRMEEALLRESASEDIFTVEYESDDVITISGTAAMNYQLPKLEFKKFGGEPREWITFWSQFSTIDRDPQMPPETKFQYLFQATAENSEVREAVESFPPSADNYPKVIEYIKSRFGEDEMLVEIYVRDLLQNVLQNVRAEGKMSVVKLYDRLETKLRALETLGVARDKFAAMLYPLVESALPEDTLRDKLTQLMTFLKTEVKGESRVNMAKAAFKIDNNQDAKDDRSNRKSISKKNTGSKMPTASDLANTTQMLNNCIFCGNGHPSQECYSGQRMHLPEKKDKAKGKNVCFWCLLPGHGFKKCRIKPRCPVCGGKHYPIMCPTLEAQKTSHLQKAELKVSGESPATKQETANQFTSTTLNNATVGGVYLQTLIVKISGPKGKHNVRVLLDCGSQRSYISKRMVDALGLKRVQQVTLTHNLFGGGEIRQKKNNGYKVNVSSLNNEYMDDLKFLDQEVICGHISQVQDHTILNELKTRGINLTDICQGEEISIHMLIGSDLLSSILTGRMQILQNGVVATETKLGWTVMGPAIGKDMEDSCLIVTSFHVNSFDVQDLWKLDVLGIMDAAETKSRKDLIEASNTHFKETVKRDESGRYILSLPWIAGHSPVPGKMLYEKYDTIFEEWEKETFIEEVEDKWEECSYLPHRPVFKDSHTTPIRPVFDASCKKKGLLSLNQCLEKGDNLIELIPDLLLRFRLGKYGIIADIRKAFLQIQVREEDREYLRFLWWKKDQKTLKFYRHCRVVFGLTSSPFLLAATIKYHLSLPQFQDNRCAELLARSFYVDNCILSLSSTNDVKKIIKESSDIMMQAKFELRDWMWNEPGITEQDPTSILGTKWHLQTDTIAINVQSLKNIDEEKSITKRSILSACHRIFDPIQFTCPATIKIKKMVQDAWKENKSWDEPLNEDRWVEFIKWRKQALELDQIKIPRWILPIKGRTTLHVFCDASAIAYATVIFMRIENASVIVVRFVEARNRLATIKRITIPRLELLACLIGARLLVHVLENLEESPEKIQCWTDSSPALYWIQQQENWAQFVSNRVKEITLTKSEDWNHVAGEHNPADLPSRGESPSKFTKSGWWEGPKWLQEKKEDWPVSKVQYDLEAIEEERRKTVVAGFVAKKPEENPWYLNLYEGKREVTLTQILRVIAWMLRFKPSEYKGDIISQEELDSAEKSLVKIIQSESIGEEDPKMKQLHAFQDKEGLWRVKTRITLRSVLREKFWIPKARQLVRHVIHKCPRCRRFETKRVDVPEASLPQHRVRDVVVFEVTGIDLGGPLYLEDGQKVWFVIFTCGVYRAVHLELVTSLSTEALVGAVERFVARRGCPAVIYSDNGTNLVGLRNELYRVNFGVKWKLNPPAAPWWGGWIERIVGLTKKLLRRLLGKRVVNYEEMVTILENCERVINARPLTYIAEDNDDLVPLTPEMFLREPRTEGEIDLNEFRFRSEYLGLLVHHDNRKKQRQLKVGDIVFVEVENRKQINWPMGKITKVFPGTDNVRRLVEVKTKSGFMKRAVQRLFPLEVPSEDVEQGDGELKPAEDEIVREKTSGVESASVREKTTPVKKLLAIHEQKSEFTIGLLWQQFFDARLTSETISDYIAKIENISAQISQMGGTITEDQKVAKILNTLPSSMRYFVAAWESLDPKAQTLNNLTARLLIEETRNQQSGSSKQDEALLHRQARTKPKDTQRSFQDAKKNTKCHYCHKIGHWSRECRKRLANEKNKSKNLHDSKGSSSDYGLILCDNQVEPNDIWYADSGASCSMTFRREWFKTYTPFTSDHPIYLGDNSTLLAEGMGDIEIQAYVDGGWYNTYIRNVLYSPQLKKNLYSLSTSTRRGFNVIIKHDKLQIFMDNDLKAVGVRHDDLYRMLFKVTSSSQGYITSENKLQLWHERLAHLPVATLREMATKGLVDGLQPQDLEGEFFFCEGCQLGKAHRKSCYPSDGKNYQLGEFIYADICGPMQTQSLSKYLYFCLFKDYFSGYRHIYFIKNKSDVLDIFKEYATLIYTQTGNKIKVLRTDNALEFKSDNFADLCKRFGIIHEFTAPYVHEQIGRIERDNRTIVEAARSMLNSRNLPGFFWAEACNTATYILNRSATKQTPGTTPYELFFGTKPNVMRIQAKILDYGIGKLEKIRISKDVTFDEKTTPHSDRESTKPKEIIFQINSAPDESPVATANIPVQEMPPVSDINSERWKLAMDEEIDALNENKTWTLERLADGHKPIGCKWVYKIKTESDGTIQRFKARLVAKGYSQIKNVDYFDTFSPVVRYDSLRILLSHAASERMFLKQFDVKTAFLNGELEELVYLEQPEGYKRDDNSCYRLHKSLYGLKQSSRNWNKKFTNFLNSHNFKTSDADPCIFIGTHNDSNVILALYVDDGIILSKDKEAIAIIMDELEHAFEITSGSVNFFVGLQIEQSEDRASIFIHQSSYIDKILSKFNMADCIPASVPMDPSVILTKKDCPTPEQKEKMPKFPFREAVGSLMFASCVSRPDITYAVSQALHTWEFSSPGEDQLVGYSDSDFARDVDSRKSTTGYAFMMNGGTVSWASQRQPIIALSTTESEYIAACSAAKELIWIRRLLQGIGCDITKETELYIDNQAAIKLVENPVFHKRTKHIDVRYHFIRSKHEEGELKVHHVCSSEQLADIMTKPLPRNKFHYLRGLLNILDREGVLE
ncbi:hypothetical protein LAZ67_1001953 [Cordylochernes scorpioides]|uniref:Uncharacterized protein n=1 Tax=Cordylochernes scorpioides TaxID=51811 RepID=A0ABY6JYI8_9ARAC|nr:hypothetical protein LAZ67_1001953 [Cordylochernes scorpioides]